MPRLPTQERPYSLGSSARKSIDLDAYGPVATPESRSARAISSAGGDAGDAVKTAARRHGVAVRADRDHAERGIAAFEPADQIAGGIDARRKSGLGKALREQGRGLRETAAVNERRV